MNRFLASTISQPISVVNYSTTIRPPLKLGWTWMLSWSFWRYHPYQKKWSLRLKHWVRRWQLFVNRSPDPLSLADYFQNLLCSAKNALPVLVVRPNHLFALLVTTPASTPLLRTYWPFDGDLNDVYSGYNGVSINNVSFSTPGITGHGSALCLNASRNQSVLIDSANNPNISWTSFTFQLWVYPYSLALNPQGDRGMIGQCQNTIANQCLHMTIRDNTARISFMSNPCQGTEAIIPNNWSHLAFVYDYTSTSQTVYVNGLMYCMHLASPPLQITRSTPLTIGYTVPVAPYFFDGLMDEVSLVGWARNTSEILDAATLVAHYSFDNQSLLDSGPNRINGIGSNLTFANNTLLFNTSSSYFQASNFVLLSVENQSYSFSLWVYPFRTNGSTILQVSQNNIDLGTWRLPFLSFDSQGRVLAQSWTSEGPVDVLGPLLSPNKWTHLCQTYSLSSGVRLYVNGSLFNASLPCDYTSRSSLTILTLGSSFQSGNGISTHGLIQLGQYEGAIDEFRVYSRELNSTDVAGLAR